MALIEDSLTRRLVALGIDPQGNLDEGVTIGRARLAEPISVTSLPQFDIGDQGSDLVTRGVLAEGGMGRVLNARQTALARDVAVKTTKALPSALEVSYLLREAVVVGGLEHPSIVPIYTLGTTADGQPLLVMRKIEGVTWAELLRDPTSPAWERHAGAEEDRLETHIDILAAIARALEFAHERGIVHRDVKPGNVMLGRYGEVYLVDWGLACAIGTCEPDELVGTPGYMAPEMANGEEVDATTDVYLLGATLHRVLTGQVRHRGETTLACVSVAMVSAVEEYPPDVPRALADLCNAACSPVRSARPPSAAAFREELLSFKRHRASLEIRAVASGRLTALEVLLEDSPGAAPKELALAYRLATEARFGFAQALALHPSDQETQAGAAAALERLVDLELRQGHLDTAAALLDEAPESKRLLLPKIEEARAAQRVALDQQASDHALGRSLDPRKGWGARNVLSVVVLVIMIVSNLTIPGPQSADDPGSPFVVGVAVISSAVIVIAVIVGRRRLLANAFASRLFGFFALAVFGMLVSRSLAYHHRTPYWTVFVNDLVIFAMATSGTALTLIPRFVVTVPILMAAAIAIELHPEWAFPIFPWTATLVYALGSFFIWQHPRLARPKS